ncbi:MAG: polyprenyl synthetase family protein [Proteobacteria bacterium]|jgi:geranylgeranyl pyrophosphate synthase|nr:polyprenyl synthetase family protein [Pseudomonadota bacterium]MDA0958082.1 polyprenyl synthetase family protein [Pseudomonadota bacterium]
MTTDPLSQYRDRIETKLSNLLTSASDASSLGKAMRYACLGGGKRLRACLAYLSAEALGLSLDDADSTAMAVELIHGYSLIHDDLPSMDDDALRRGKPSTHIAFGEAEAILAGDALQALAFQVIADDVRLSAETKVGLIAALSRAAGAKGMVGGQALDMMSEHQTLEINVLAKIHSLKTGALISFAAASAGFHPDRNASDSKALKQFGEKLGLAFQVQDDILDETSSTETLGKQQGSDKAQAKSTFVSALGLAGAQNQLSNLIADATDSLKQSGLATPNLIGLIAWLRQRNY